jgi:FkbM family methyltransferase
MDKETVRLWLWRKFGIAMWRKALPFGADVYLDLYRLGFRPRIIFDVGANIGQKSLCMSKMWPDANIHAFEPVAKTFQALCQNVAKKQKIRPWNLAVSDSIGTAEIFLDEHYSELSSMNKPSGGRSERINITTLDAFRADHAVSQVDLMKIDTEGHEESVLRGARGMFEQNPPSLCVIEAGFNGAQPFVPAEVLVQSFGRYGYRFAGSYDHLINSKGHFLERADLLFVHNGNIG